MINFIGDLLLKTSWQVWSIMSGNWPFLVVSALVAAWMKVYVDQEKVAAFLRHHQRAGVFAATATAVGTPLCSCGTTAVILGMMASRMPWAPIVAFMVASPLTSPQELVYSAGLFGWPFALTFFIASIVLGLMGGLAAHILESSCWLANQARFKPLTGGSGIAQSVEAAKTNANWRVLLKETFLAGRKLLAFFFAFAYVGYALNNLIPAAWVSTLFGEGHAYSVPLAATLGLPFYLNTEASLPLVRALLDAGMSAGAALAFLVTGAGTSVGAIAGALTIARWRVIGVMVSTLWIGAVIFGFAYDALLAMRIF
jgi:uncharacterized membrane protein YraQ (UPF0718 family)